MSQKSQSDSLLLGNTNAKRSRRWCFTLNNYTDNEYEMMDNYAKLKCSYYIIGKEIGGVSEISHLQGYLEFKNQVLFTTLKKLNDRIHWEPARGNREQNTKYCKKDNNFSCSANAKNMDERILEAEYKDVVWKPWQQYVLDLINGPVDQRKIYFVVDYEGNTGKSYLVKYIDLVWDVILCGGKTDNIMNQVLNAPEDKRGIVVCDVPRCQIDFMNYGALEVCKNGHMYSGKYEGGKVKMFRPHVFVFMNEMPDMSKLSKDRFAIIDANEHYDPIDEPH